MSKYSASFFVEGHPEEKGNHAAHIVKGRERPIAYIFDTNDKKLKGWQNRIKLIANVQRPPELLTGPIRLDVLFYFLRPKTVKRKHHTIAPDRDKLLRAVQDALQDVIYKNDSQVIAGETGKIYGDREGAGIKIKTISGFLDGSEQLHFLQHLIVSKTDE